MKHPKPIKPKQGQESVWAYPRPPKLERVSELVEVIFNDRKIASTTKAWRVLETSHPPTIYIPREDVDLNVLVLSTRQTYCEWKGTGRYYHLQDDGLEVMNAAWFYDNPKAAFLSIKNHLSFYPSKVNSCYIGGEQVKAQEGDFYGGWITSKIVGPFKGGPKTFGW